MRRALLVNPWIYDFKAFDFWLKPLGLLYLAAYLRQFNFEVILIDCLDRYHPKLAEKPKVDVYGRGKFPATFIEKPKVYQNIPRRYKRYGIPQELFESLLSEIKDIDYIFVTSIMTYWYLGVFDTIKILKRHFPKIPLFLGGIYATICKEHARRFSKADIVISGRFEENIFKYIPDLKPQPFFSLPFPAFDLYPKLDYACILTSRGCPFHCTYCAVPQLSLDYSYRSLASLLTEIDYYRSLAIKNIAFYDDALLSNPNFKALLIEIIKKGWHLNLHTPNGLNPRFIDEEMAFLLYAANFKTIYLSLETVSPVTQEATGGKVKTEEFLRAVELLKKAGFKNQDLHAYLIFGLPRQTLAEIKESIDFVHRLGIKVHLAEFSPIPKTKEYEEAGFDENTDPLLHNNTAFLFLKGREELLTLKKYLSQLP